MYLKRGLQLPGQVFLSWYLAGAILLGGFLVAYGTIIERVSMHAVLATTLGLFLVGGSIGFVMGGALGMFGRPLDTTARNAWEDQLHALLYMLPGMFIGFIVSGWIALTIYAIYKMSVLAIMFTSAAWIGGAAIVGWAINKGLDALANLGARVMRLGRIQIQIQYKD
jgi:hypothetical protein